MSHSIRTFLYIPILLMCCFAVGAGCSHSAEPLTIGLIPANDPAVMLEQAAPLQRYLEQELDRPVHMVVAGTYAELIERMKDGEIDIGRFGAFSYIAAQSEMELEPMVVQHRQEGFGTTYRSVIITGAESGIQTLEQLPGKSFGFVDAGSTSGFVIPYALFKSRGIDYDNYFSEIVFSGTHDQVLEDVLTGKLDAGAISDVTLQRRIDAGTVSAADVRVIWQSSDIPGSPFASKASLPESVKAGFQRAMLDIHEQDPAAMKSFDSLIIQFVKFDDTMYNEIRNLSTVLGGQFIFENFLKNAR